ncbi:MAG: ABC transporter permease [Actinobacteria bacterium]|nr:ABC transporter permease [Actinomycetota bacterium]
MRARTRRSEPAAHNELFDPATPRTQTRVIPVRLRLRRALAPRDRALQLALLVTALAAWEFFGRRASNFTFAPPSRVATAAREMIESGELQDAVTESLVALLLGFTLAAVIGISVGYAMGWWRTFGRTLNPFVSALYVVPIATLVPAMIVWFGLGLTPRVIVIMLFALFEILLNAYAGVKNVDPHVIDVARTFGASRLDLLRKAVFPATLPFVFVGLRIGASRAVKGMVLAEMLFAVTGLGRVIIENASTFRMDRVFVGVIAVSLMGVILSAAVQATERRVMRWRD